SIGRAIIWQNGESKPVSHFISSNEMMENVIFFMWCDEVQNFVDSQITCGKDENVKTLEYRVARLEDDRKDLNCIVNKTKMVVKVLPEAFSYLNIVDGDDGSESD
ncbi:hypothetical protein Taro_027467, partial [Colocasia esculenta]|nr:hypothetical protein [Colocasia esculenta]